MSEHVADLVMSHTVKTEDKQEATTGRAFIFQSACQSRHSDSCTAFLNFTPISQADAPTSTYTHTLHLPVQVLVVDVESLGGAQQLWKKIEKEGEQREEMEKDH